MVGARKLDPYLELKDKYGAVIGEWALQTGPAAATYCLNSSINFTSLHNLIFIEPINISANYNINWSCSIQDMNLVALSVQLGTP
jgi:hypothetical protein